MKISEDKPAREHARRDLVLDIATVATVLVLSALPFAIPCILQMSEH
jgi:hypothetical protein